MTDIEKTLRTMGVREPADHEAREREADRQVQLTKIHAELRIAALDNATGLVAMGAHEPTTAVVLSIADAFYAWLTRDDEA